MAQRLPQPLPVERARLPAGRTPERRHGRYRIFDIDPPRHPERAVGDHAVGHDQVEAVMPVGGQPDVAGIKVARLVIGVPPHADRRVVERNIDTLPNNQVAAGTDLADELRERLPHGRMGAVNIQVVGIRRGDHRHIGMEPEKRTVELVGFDGQPTATAQHEVAPEVPGYAPQKSAAVCHAAVEPGNEGCRGGLAVRAGDGHHVFALRENTEHLRAFDDPEPLLPQPCQLAVVVVHGGRIDRQRPLPVPEPGRDARHVVSVVNRGPLRFERRGQRRRGAVVTGHPLAFVQEKAGQRTHADAPDSEHIYVFVLHPIRSVLRFHPRCARQNRRWPAPRSRGSATPAAPGSPSTPTASGIAEATAWSSRTIRAAPRSASARAFLVW